MNKKILIALLGLVLLIIIALGLVAPQGNDSLEGDGKEPERGGPSIVALENSNKLSALLQSPEFFAAKEEISNYIVSRVDEQETSASVESTLVDKNGIVSLRITTAGGKTFLAKIYQVGDQLFFEVPSTKYQTVFNTSQLEEAE